jgi:CheY-like chemotaxis protein
MIGERNNRIFQVVVVEDNPADVDLLKYALESAEVDCSLTVFDKGADARAYFQRQEKYGSTLAPDLAILDLNLPQYDGIEILEAMRANPAFAELPVAILSSSSSPRDRARIEAYRVSRYITKPPDLDEYLRIGFTVKQLLDESEERAHSQGEIRSSTQAEP